MNGIQRGDWVAWGSQSGRVREVMDFRVTRRVGERVYKKHGSAANPVLIIDPADGPQTVLLANEVEKQAS